MKKFIFLLAGVLGCFLILACAANQEFVTEAKGVKTDALEPVVFRSEKLVASLNKIKPKFIHKNEIDELMTAIKSEIEKTNRFKHVMVLEKEDVSAETEGFVIYPEVLSLKMDVRSTYDTQRKKYIASGSACLKVYDAYDRSKEIAIFTSDKRLEKMGKSGQITLTTDEQKDRMMTVLKFVFLDLAIQMGDKFNPSYEMGTIEKISGKTVYVYIKTDRLRNLKAKQQQIAVIDDDNKPLATIEPINIADGSLTGIFNTKANGTIKTGMKVRARIFKTKD